MVVTAADGRREGVEPAVLASLFATRVEAAMQAYREARSPGVLLRAAQRAAAATLALLLLLVLALSGLRRLDLRISRTFDERIHSVQIQSFEIVRAQRLRDMLRAVTRLVRLAVLE